MNLPFCSCSRRPPFPVFRVVSVRAGALLIALFLLIPLSGYPASEPGTFLIDPGQGGFDAGSLPAPGWSTSLLAGASAVAIDPAVQSPFSAGAGSLLLHDADDGTSGNTGPRVSRSFVAQACGSGSSGTLLWSFEYRIPEGAPDSTEFSIRLAQNLASGVIGPELFLGRGGYLQARNGSSLVPLLAVAAGTWYHVEVTVRLETRTYDVAVASLAADGETGPLVVLASGFGFFNTPVSLAVLASQDTVAGTAGGALHLDNITLRVAAETDAVVYNVKAFGAAGDGIADDGAAIASAVATLKSAGLAGVLYFPDGRYRRGSSGHGLVLNGVSDTTVLFAPDAVLVMDNLVIQNGKKVGSGHGVYVQGPGARLSFIGVHVRWAELAGARSMGDGFRFLGYPGEEGNILEDLHFRDCRTERSPQTGAIFLGCATVDVRNFYVEDSLADGLHFNACNSVTVDTVTGINTGDDTLAFVTYYDPVLIYDQSHYNQPDLNPVWNNAHSTATGITSIGGAANGVRISGGRDITVSDVYVDGKASCGVVIDSARADGMSVRWTYLASRGITLSDLTLLNCDTGLLVHYNPATNPLSSDPVWSGFDVTVTGANTISGAANDSIHLWNCAAIPGDNGQITGGVRIAGVEAAGRRIRVRNSRNCSLTDISLEGASFAVIGATTISPDLGDLPDSDIALDDIVVTGGSLLVQNGRGFTVGSLEVRDAPTDGVIFQNVVQPAGYPAVSSIAVTYPNRNNQAGARALLLAKCQGLTIDNYDLIQDDHPIRSVEIGGGDAAAVTSDVAVMNMNYVSGIVPLSPGHVIQGGAWAPVSWYLNLYYSDTAGQNSGHYLHVP
ncbi:hypothetical protein OpiT1DRAFT_02791 [Opitutaceae bacterium TAV1]|nr:hypothetical protein OpiT1DRAFT_02791 [Opitutaceae bacterium TAV1]